MFAFEKWHSAIEMRRYILRFIHHIDGLPDLSALKFTKYNQYESLVLPLVNYLKKHNVQFEYDTVVKNVIVEHVGSDMVAKELILEVNGVQETRNLTENDLVFVTNGSITAATTYGDNNTSAPISKESWFVSATTTVKDKRIAEYIQKISKRDPYAGKVVTGGIVTVRDSNWMMSYTLNRQPHFKAQSKDELVVWIYGLYSGIKGNYVEKPIEECTGIEIAEEWLYHMATVHSLFQTVQKILPSSVTSLKLLAIQCSQQNILFVQRWKLYIHCLMSIVVCQKCSLQLTIYVFLQNQQTA